MNEVNEQQDLTGKPVEYKKVGWKDRRKKDKPKDYEEAKDNFEKAIEFDPSQFLTEDDMLDWINRQIDLTTFSHLGQKGRQIIKDAKLKQFQEHQEKRIEEEKETEKFKKAKEELEKLEEYKPPTVERIPEIPTRIEPVETVERAGFRIGALAQKLLQGMLGRKPEPKAIPSDYRDIRAKTLEHKTKLTGAKEQEIEERGKGIGFRITQIVTGIRNTATNLIKRMFG